jgi:hypothetical protein
MSGRIEAFLEADHARLAALLARATARPGVVDAEAFWELRTGLLKHIGMEERILFPAARAARQGENFPWAQRLREDHGLLASLLVPTPTPERVARIITILDAHNGVEEGVGGAYDDCEAALGEAGIEAVLERLKNAPTPPPAPYCDRPRRNQP